MWISFEIRDVWLQPRRTLRLHYKQNMLGYRWIRHLQLVVACLIVAGSAGQQLHMSHGTNKPFQTGEPPKAATLLRPARQTRRMVTVRGCLVASLWRGQAAPPFLLLFSSGYNETCCTGRKLLQVDPAKNCSVTIQTGDTLDILGAKCGADLAKYNPSITDVNIIQAGECICVPNTCTALIGTHKS